MRVLGWIKEKWNNQFKFNLVINTIIPPDRVLEDDRGVLNNDGVWLIVTTSYEIIHIILLIKGEGGLHTSLGDARAVINGVEEFESFSNLLKIYNINISSKKWRSKFYVKAA